MKRKLTFLLTAFLLLTGMTSWGQLRSTITDQLDRELTGVTGTSYTSWEGKTSNSEAVYAGQSAGGNESIQLRSNNSNSGIITTASGGTITNVTVTWNENTANGRTLNVYGSHTAYTSPTELYDAATQGTMLGTIVNGTSTELEITDSYEYIGLRSASGAMYLTEIDITWEAEGGVPPTPNVAAPTFTPAGGTYYEAQTVSITCTTEDATIYYSLASENGPWMVFASPITINETTTIWAYAVKEGYNDSPVVNATYTISNAPSVITIAEARALANNDYALVQGVVTFIDGRNVYIQDATAGIDLFLNSNTVPSTLALGDMVQAYGKRATYNGLAELSNINGNDTEQFSILSSGNTLPLVVKTIAEIIEGGADALQCTRVKVEGAIIGAINTNNNTPLTQDGSTINIYKVPALTGIEEGDVVDVISVVGYFNVPQLRVALASDVVLSETPIIPDPQLTVSTSQLDDFSYVFGEGPSTPKNFTVSGTDLEANVSLTAPQDYEISLDPDNGYEGSKELTPVGGTLAETMIYVRLKAGLAVGTYSGNLAIVSGELNHNITLNGTIDEMSIVTVTIAEARALDNGQFAQVEGTVIFLDGRNVYIQDATAGIDLYLNSNTVPESLAVGDNVRAYGSKTVYKGLVELTGINGGNADEFSILSSGNELPLAVKTIAEINSDFSANNLLQSTRVKIENAIVGTINPSGTTVISQDGNDLNVYRIPTVEGLTEGDLITITGIIGCYNTPQLRVASADDIVFSHNSSVTASPMSLSGFEYEYEAGGPSDIQIFTVGGDMLTNNVSIIPSESFEVSTQPAELFQPENPAMIYIPESGSFFGIEICVRLKAGLEVGTYTERIAIASEDTDTLFVNVSGTVIGETPTPPDPPTPPTPGTGEYVRISDLSQLAAGSYVVFAARFDGNAADYYAMSNTSSGKPTGVLFTSTISESYEILPASITDEESNYYWIVGVTANGYTFTNAAGEMIGYTSSTNFTTNGDNTEWSIEFGTAGEAAMVPNYAGFLVTNVNNDLRHFALNSNHNFGPYHSNNFNTGGYNFYLDLFVKTEGITPPTPTVSTPTFTPEAGTYTEEQNVSITCATEGATIYYSTVSENGPWTAYAGAITVGESMTIWAYAMMEGYNDSPVASATYTIQNGGTTTVTIFNQDWEGEMNGWTFVDVEGEMSWTVAQYSGNHYAYANGYNHGANEDWCISPSFNLDAIANPVLSFRTAKNYNGPDLEVYFSNEYDGQNMDPNQWQQLDGFALSPGSWTWTESGDIDLGSYNGTNCYIGFKYTSEENSAAGWEVDDIMLVGQTSTTSPIVNVTPLTLTGFTYMEGSGQPSDEQSFTVSGFNLSGNVTVTPDTYYEISQTSGNGFSQNPIILEPVNGVIEETTIFVHLKVGLPVGNYNQYITISSPDVEDIQVACSGSVTAQPVPGGDYIRISAVSELADGNQVILASRYNETANAYLAITNTLTSGGLGTTEFTSQMNGSDEVIPASIMANESDYYWTVGVTPDGYTFTNANGDVIGYGNSGTNFVMNSEKTIWTVEIGVSDTASLVPEYTGFNIINATTTNRGFALRMLEGNGVVKAYSTSNMNNSNAGEYNFSLDIFMQGEGGTCTVAAPTFDPAGGTYYEPQNVTISCATEGATIWYSLIAGSGPWTPYTEAITVEDFASIWAYATKEGCNDSPVVNAGYVIQNDIVIIFNQDWEEDWHGWTEVLETGDSLWRIASYQGNHYAYANGYNHPATIDWLISPAFDLDSYSGEVLTFRTAKNYTGLDIEVFFSNDYDGQDPTTATWEQLECELSQGGWNWVESGEISLDEYSGTNCYIGFRYTCTDDEAAGWEVDDIMLTAGGGATPTPTLIATPNALSGFNYVVGNGPSTPPQTYTLTGANLEGEGYITVTVSEKFEILNDDGNYSSSPFELHYSNGVIDDQPVTITVRMKGDLPIGPHTGQISHEGGGATAIVTLSGIVYDDNEPSIAAAMPLYIQGNNGSNNDRVPVAIQVTMLNLEPNTTYRYTNQFVDGNDGPETAGAGNVIYVSNDGFYRTTSPSLATEGGYGEFTTTANGSQILWFMNEPTANARFTPGNHVYLRIRINDGHDGTEVDNTFTTDDYATVLNFSTENDEYCGSAFYVKSEEAPMSFAMLLSDANNYRPLYSTSIETTGVDYGSINQYADFYKELVAGKDGWFGGILPNVNPDGVNRIVIWDIYSHTLNEYYSENGQWNPEANTVNPNAGLDDPIFIDLTYEGVEETVEANVKVWNTDHEFVVENGDNAHYTMTVYNILGQPMMMKQINAGSADRISHSLASGIYVIRLQNNQNSVSVKVFVR
jgi:hypothetical protein